MRSMILGAIAIWALDVVVSTSRAAPVITVEPETSDLWPSEQSFESRTATSADLLGPFAGMAVHFRGFAQGGNQVDQLGNGYLIYRYRIEFASPATLDDVTIEGAAFTSPDSVIRLLDAEGIVVDSTTTSGGNSDQSFSVSSGAVADTVFFLEEYDSSPTWRFRSRIDLEYTVLTPPAMEVSVGPGTSSPWDAGTTFESRTSTSADPGAPFAGGTVHFRGVDLGGNNTDSLGASHLVYRYRLDFECPVTIEAATISGAGFTGPDNILRLLDADGAVVDSVATFGGNSDQAFSLSSGEVSGTRFFIEEYDTSTAWRYRSEIAVTRVALPQPAMVVTVEPETSAPWPSGEAFEGRTAASGDPMAPFAGESVHFRGVDLGGNNTDSLGEAHLIYRYRLDFELPVSIDQVEVRGAGFTGSESVLRLLDDQGNVLDSIMTFGGNSDQTFTVSSGGVFASTYFIEEYDSSSAWRYRSSISVKRSAAPVEIIGYQIIGHDVQISFQSHSGFTYHLWRSNDLVTWIQDPQPHLGTGAPVILQFTEPANLSRQFYRVTRK